MPERPGLPWAPSPQSFRLRRHGVWGAQFLGIRGEGVRQMERGLRAGGHRGCVTESGAQGEVEYPVINLGTGLSPLGSDGEGVLCREEGPGEEEGTHFHES